ncbi:MULTISPECIES: DHA2 family efflux MFS transporter permease subunit [unclassified Actinomyces]|uniref:DHA2 family efflux MFS transporter permease subunit n=1 Tax=unclassified Actinomyces TaxID=2609248 RepID=UPI000D59139C|nr:MULTISPECIES: DHA2 family efflux MFS transporter permease subunit [unclassified Actinomyces]RAX23239.1 MFS transporter [Actinomyces sp. Z3]
MTASNVFERRLDARLVIAVVAIGVMSFAGVVVETAMNIAFPALMAEFGIATSTVQWITTGYLLVLAVIMPISSLLNRRFRTRGLFVAAGLAFLAGTLLCALAPGFAPLVLGRLIQGVGAGIALPLMFNLVLEQAPLERLGMMMGIATLITAIAPAVGPSLGGFLIGAYGWRSVFWVLVPFLLVSLLLGVATIRQSHPTAPAPFSPVQFLLLATGFTALVIATSSASTAGFASPRVLGLLVLAVVLVAAFCLVSARSQAPLLRVGVFLRPVFTLSILYVVLVQATVLALGYLIPYYAQVADAMGAFAAGCLLLPGCIVGACLTPFGGRVLDALGPARPIRTGAAFGVATLVLFALIGTSGSATRMAWIYVLMPICQGLSVSNSMTNGLRTLPDDLQPDGNAAFNTIQQLGGAIGTAVAATIVATAQVARPDDVAAATTAGTRIVFWTLLGVMLVAALLAVVATGRQNRPLADAVR